MTNTRNPVRKQVKKKGDAQRKVEETLKQLNEGVDGRKGITITFEQVARDWFKVHGLSSVKNSTLRSRNSTIKLLVRYVGQLPISRISYDTRQKIFIDLSQKEFSRSLMVHAKVTADFISQHSKKQKLRIDNPVIDVVIPKKQVTVEQVENEVLEEKYFERMNLKHFWMHRERLIFGELCALKWTDIFY